MKNILHITVLLLIGFNCFGQARVILNNGGIIVLNGGTAANSIFLVVDNPNSNAITRNTSGHIISEGQFNKIKWNIGNTVGTYTVPYGIGAATYIPNTMTTSSALGAGNLTFSTYTGSWLNSSYLPVGVTNFFNNGGGDASPTAIDRFWRIEPTGYTTKPALTNLIFTYRDIEHSVASNTIIEANLMAQRYNTGTNEWDDYIPGSVTTPASNINTVPALPSAQLYTWWTLTDNRAPLPIELSTFNAVCDGNKINITWTTLTERENDFFEVEKSMDAVNFESVVKVNSQNSNSTSTLNYNTIDNNPINGKSYYRLKQVDKNGEFSYSSVVVVECNSTVNSSASVSIFPNPATDNISINIKGLAGKKSIVIYDVLGQEMTNKIIQSKDENALEIIDISTFSNASYILRIDVNNELHQVIKFVKK